MIQQQQQKHYFLCIWCIISEERSLKSDFYFIYCRNILTNNNTRENFSMRERKINKMRNFRAFSLSKFGNETKFPHILDHSDSFIDFLSAMNLCIKLIFLFPISDLSIYYNYLLCLKRNKANIWHFAILF